MRHIQLINDKNKMKDQGRPKKWTDDLVDWCNKDIGTLYRLATDRMKWTHFMKKKSQVAEIPPHYVPFICWSGRSRKSSMCLLRRSINSAIEATATIPLKQSIGSMCIFCEIVFIFSSLFSFKAIYVNGFGTICSDDVLNCLFQIWIMIAVNICRTSMNHARML